jgi:hypothetical protein
MRQPFDYEGFEGQIVRCQRCGHALGRLVRFSATAETPGGWLLNYGRHLYGEDVAIDMEKWEKARDRLTWETLGSVTWALRTAHRPKERPGGWRRLRSNDRLWGGRMIPCSHRVRCRCGFITSLAYLSARDFASPTY